MPASPLIKVWRELCKCDSEIVRSKGGGFSIDGRLRGVFHCADNDREKRNQEVVSAKKVAHKAG